MWRVECVSCTSAPPSPGGHVYRATSRQGLLGLLLRHSRHGRLVVMFGDLARPSAAPTRGRRPAPQDVFERALTMSARIAGLAIEELYRRGGWRVVRRILRQADRPTAAGVRGGG